MNQQPRRRDFLKVMGTAAVAGPAMLPTLARGAAPARKPNLLMIVADDQRTDTIHALGNDLISTPTLDKLVARGVAFRHCRTMGSQQGAVCVPSRAMLHTGRPLFRVPDNCGDFPTLGQTLLQNGYNAFGCGKWHNQAPSFSRSFNSGGNIFLGGMHDQYQTPVHDYSPDETYGAKSVRTLGKFSTEVFSDAAIGFLGKQTGDKPFFCYCAFTSPHDPRTPPPPFKTMYDPAKMPLPKNWLPQHPFDNGDLRVRDEKLAPFPRTKEDTCRQLCDYYGMVSSQDFHVGRILAALEASGQAENTIIVYTGDHGLAIGSHGLFGKQNVYEHSSGVPLLISGPGIPAGKTSEALCYGMDIFPTVCDLMEVAPPKTVEGKSLAKVISGSQAKVRDSAFHAYCKGADTQKSIRDERWKMIRYDVKGKKTTQLFDMQNDPFEIKDLSTDPVASGEIPRLEVLMKQWQQEVGDTGKHGRKAATSEEA